MNHNSAYRRYQIIDQCLNSRKKHWTKKELLQELSNKDYDISPSTLEKDIWKMRYENSLPFENAPVEWDPKRRAYFYSRDFAINIPVNDQEIRSLEVAVRTLNQFKDIGYFSQFTGAVDKVIRFVRQMKASHENSATPTILFEKVPYLSGYEYLDTILVAVNDRKCLQIIYQTFDYDEPYEVILHPYFVKEFHNRWYVVGLVDHKKELRTFALDRIQSISSCTTNYINNIDTDPEEYFKDCIGINFMKRDIETVRLSFTPYQGKYLKTQHLHRSQIIIKDDSEAVVVELRIIINHELKMLILSFGDQVKVLEPISLATDIAKISRRVAKSYDSNLRKS